MDHERTAKVIKCRDCGEDFSFGVSEQKFFSDNNFVDPQRCRPCRATKRQRYAEDGRATDSRIAGGWHR